MSKSAAFGIAIPCEIQSKGTDLKWTWACGNSSHTWPTSTVYSFKDMWGSLLMEVESTPEVVAKMVTCTWALWSKRNEIRQGGKWKMGLELVRGATQYLEAFYAANNVENVASTQSITPVRWVPS